MLVCVPVMLPSPQAILQAIRTMSSTPTSVCTHTGCTPLLAATPFLSTDLPHVATNISSSAAMMLSVVWLTLALVHVHGHRRAVQSKRASQ